MALKKPMKRPTKKPTTSPKPSAASTVVASPEPKKRVAVPPPVRKPVPPPARKPVAPPVKQAPAVELPKTEPKVEEPPKAMPKRPVRKPIARKPEPPKEVTVHEPETKVEPPVETEVRKSPEAPKPAPTTGGNRQEPGHRRIDTPAVKRVSVEAMRAMEHEERWKLFKSLNKDPEKFTPIRSELPKTDYMRKDEALIREIISERPPRVKGADVLYCPYCVDWQVFYTWVWMGSTKCTGCGIGSKDFHTRTDNKLWGKEL